MNGKRRVPHVRRWQVWGFILQYCAQYGGLFPTVREIQAGCRISTTSLVNWHIRHLRAEGLIDKRGKRFYVVGSRWNPPLAKHNFVQQEAGHA